MDTFYNEKNRKMSDLMLSGFGKIYRFYPILKMEDFNISNFPVDMEQQGILGAPLGLAMIMSNLHIEYNGKFVRGKKGAYVKRQDFISHLIQPSFVVYEMGNTIISQSFELSITEDIPFTLRDLQLHKSYREILAIPYGIIPTEISYQGVIIKGDPKEYIREDTNFLYPSLPFLQVDPMPAFNFEMWLSEKLNDTTTDIWKTMMNDTPIYNITLCTIQYISAKRPDIHSYLKDCGCNSQRYAFFFCQVLDESSQCQSEVILMLCQSGIIYFLLPEGKTYIRVPVTDQSIIDTATTVLHQEVNGRHPYLKPVLESYMTSICKSTTTSFQPLF